MKKLGLCCVIAFSFMSCNENEKKEVVDKNEFTADSVITECDCKELSYDPSYNAFYLEKPKDGFTGICKTYYKNGQVELNKSLKDGKTHGTVLSYYENGQLKSSKEFDMNLQIGKHMAYSEDGSLIFYGKYERGKLVEKIVSQPIR